LCQLPLTFPPSPDDHLTLLAGQSPPGRNRWGILAGTQTPFVERQCRDQSQALLFFTDFVSILPRLGADPRFGDRLLLEEEEGFSSS
jgi:hypothetical protein